MGAREPETTKTSKWRNPTVVIAGKEGTSLIALSATRSVDLLMAARTLVSNGRTLQEEAAGQISRDIGARFRWVPVEEVRPEANRGRHVPKVHTRAMMIQ
jgi:hypothetical protein